MIMFNKEAVLNFSSVQVECPGKNRGQGSAELLVWVLQGAGEIKELSL